jgi:hypothetical protein
MRAARLVTSLALLAGCAHQRPVDPSAPLRLSMTAGQTVFGRCKLSLDVDMGAARGDRSGGSHLALAFTARHVEHVDSIAPDGTAQLSTQLTDVRAAGSQSADAAQIDAFAGALGRLRVTLDRSPRGEVNRLEVTEVSPPLTEQTARALLTVLYSAKRGPILPAGDERTFTVRKPLPEVGGFVGQSVHTCTLTSRRALEARIGCDDHTDGQGGDGPTARHMTVRSTGEYTVAAGALRASTVDDLLTVELAASSPDALSTGVRQHVRVSFTRE